MKKQLTKKCTLCQKNLPLTPWTNVEDMSDTQRYKQMGNAVTVNVIRDIIAKIIE